MTEEVSGFEKYNLSAAQLQSLREAGFYTLESIGFATLRELKAIPGIGEKTVDKLWKDVQASHLQFVPANIVLEKRKQNVKFLTTGSRMVNELLGGGVETQSVTEIAGINGSGKTQFAHQLCVNVQLPPEKGGIGPEAGALYITSERSFRGERLMEMARAVGIDPDQALSRVLVAEALNSDHQIYLLDQADRVVKQQNIRLLIIDSLIAHFRAEYVGREVLAPRQQALNSHYSRLSRLASAYNLAAFVTNQMQADPVPFIPEMKQAGGNIVGHASTTRLLIRQPSKMKELRVIRMAKSPWRPNGEAICEITEKGVVDVENA